MSKEKKTYNEEIESKGYFCNTEIIHKTYWEDFYDLDGYKYFTTASNILSGAIPKRVAVVNKFSTDNIINYLKLNYPDIELLDGQEFERFDSALLVRCKIHGVIETTWDKIISPYGICVKCGKEKREVYLSSVTKTLEETINDFKNKHGDKYDYSLVSETYKNIDSKIKIICDVHGVFEQDVHSHKRFGCKKCSDTRTGLNARHNQEEAMNKILEVHGNKYEYPDFNYRHSNDKINITCKKHGDFTMKYTRHVHQSQGCKWCAYDRINSTGWDAVTWMNGGKASKNFTGFKTYIVKCWNEKEVFWKCGITFIDIKNRFKTKKEMPYNYEIIEIINFGEDAESAELAWNLERKIHKENESCKYTPFIPFGGSVKECFFLPLSFNNIT